MGTAEQKAKIQSAIDKIKNSGSEKNKSNVEQLEKSNKKHEVTIPEAKNAPSRNISKDERGYPSTMTGTEPKSSTDKTGTNTITQWNPSETLDGTVSPESVLAHELDHACKKDSGELQDDLAEREKDAIDTGSDYRDHVDEERRPYNHGRITGKQ